MKIKCISSSYRGVARNTFSNQWIPKDQFGRHRLHCCLFSNAFHRRSPNRPHLILAPVSLSATFPSAALNHYNLVFDLYRPSRQTLQFFEKCQCAMFRQLLLPRFLNSNPCDKLRLSRHLLKSRSNVLNSRHQIIAIMAFLSTQLVDRDRNHQLRTSLTGFSSPTSFSFTLSPLNAMSSNLCPKSILIKATNQAYLLKGSSDDNKRCGIFFIGCVAIVLLFDTCFAFAIDIN